MAETYMSKKSMQLFFIMIHEWMYVVNIFSEF